MHQNTDHEFDVVIIGSGFGGSVSAMRLTQKGYRVAILEKGKRYRKTDFPTTNWNIKKYIWLPLARCFGFQKITFLKGVMLLHGVGVGGGSLVYANTLMRPRNEIFESGWPAEIAWTEELSPHYEMASRMLGVTRNRQVFDGDRALHAVSKKLGVEDSFHQTDVGVFFGEPDQEVDDPYFSGDGPKRTGCNSCGGCMVGCRYGAKNTLDYNYLYFAEKWGAKVFAETKVTKIKPTADGYEVETKRPLNWIFKKGKTFRAKKIILAAGVLGSTEILLKNRDVYKTLPGVSTQLGHTVRTNGESLLGATSFDKNRDYSKGLAIGTAFQADSITTVEAVRYPKGSGLMRMLAVPLTPAGNLLTRPLKMLGQYFLRAHRLVRLWTVDWAKNTVILLVMQATNTRLKLNLGRNVYTGFRQGLTGDTHNHEPVPSFRPVAQESARLLAKEMKGEAQNIISEVIFRTPATAHMLGGACIGKDPTEGVVDSNHEVFGYPGLYVCDGSVIPTNLGVNPSLTITALAERFAEKWPETSNEDQAVRKERRVRFSSKPTHHS